jgi:hypothetical protein
VNSSRRRWARPEPSDENYEDRSLTMRIYMAGA